jgi:cytochrome c oxidase subunit 4
VNENPPYRQRGFDVNAKPPYRKLGLVWLALMVLLALTCASAYLPMGVWNTVVNFAIAAMKALLVAAFFMHLLGGRPVHRVVGCAALFILALLLGLSLSDYLTRPRYDAPWQVPNGAVSSAVR